MGFQQTGQCVPEILGNSFPRVGLCGISTRLSTTSMSTLRPVIFYRHELVCNLNETLRLTPSQVPGSYTCSSITWNAVQLSLQFLDIVWDLYCYYKSFTRFYQDESSCKLESSFTISFRFCIALDRSSHTDRQLAATFHRTDCWLKKLNIV
jgi:hypothetical protein